MAQICLSSHHPSLAALLSDPEFKSWLRHDSALVELRLDRYQDLTPAALARAFAEWDPHQLVVTFRRAEEGGEDRHATDEARCEYLLQAIQAQAAFVDLELATLRRPQLRAKLWNARGVQSRTRIIASHHDFEGVPNLEELRRLRRLAEELDADVVKLAVRPKTILEGLPLLDLLCEEAQGQGAWRRPLIGLAMGEEGFWSRVLGPLFPSPCPFTFARATQVPGTAPGQPTWQELLELYDFPNLERGHPVYGVIGNPIGHSRSPLLHNTGLRALGLPGVYLPFKVEGDPVRFVREFGPRLGLRGLSVTIPHKEEVMAACTTLDPVARQIGAVNTLVPCPGASRDQPDWHGLNTDALAAAESLETALGGRGALRDKQVLILGAGGAARAVAFGVKARGAEVLIYNRTLERGRKLAQEVGGGCVNKSGLLAAAGLAAVVNTTPLGMHPEVARCPLEEAEIPEGTVVFDTVYVPLDTVLLKRARKKGCRTLSGLAMFVGQGVAQFERFTGRCPPQPLLEEAIRNSLECKN